MHTSESVPLAREMTARLFLGAVVGLAAGALTLWSDQRVPWELEPLANSAAPWILVAGAVALTARGAGEALVLAVVTLLTLVLGFYLAEGLRGWPVSRHEVVFWSVTSVMVGPMVGLAADWLRRGSEAMASVGAGLLGGMLAGEAVYGHTQLRFSTPHEYWYVQFALGVALAVGLPLWRSRRRWQHSVPAVAVSVAACAVAGLGTLAAYQLP
jgi:hypothetical protein